MRYTIGLTVGIFTIMLGAAAGQTTKSYSFLTHAAFFSVETKQPNLLDPQVFVSDASSQAATGPQGIAHVAGYRPAFGVDDAAAPASNAQGKALGITLGQWFGARGSVALSPSDGGNTSAALSFSGLIPRGRYSLFENHFTSSGVTFTPLDGTAKTNSFTASADGSAKLTVLVPGAITHAEAILLVYHSDGVDHGMQRGEIGMNAHHQLIMRVP